MVRPSGDTSSEIHVPSVAVNCSERVAISGNVEFLAAALAALSAWVTVWLRADAATRGTRASKQALRRILVIGRIGVAGVRLEA